MRVVGGGGHCSFFKGWSFSPFSILYLKFADRIQTCHVELEREAAREKKLTEDNKYLVDRISHLEKECASLTLELKALQNRYQQEIQSRESHEKNRIVSKDDTNLEVVKGNFAVK